MPDASPDITILLPCLNALPRLQDALASVHAALDGFACEIVAADGGSTDATRDVLAAAGAVVAPGGDRSIYGGLNKALALSRGRYVLWLNADDRVEPALAAMAQRTLSEAPEIATGEAAIRRDDTELWRSDHAAREMDAVSVLFSNPTINSRLISRALMERVGRFREDVDLAGDREMMLRLARTAQHRIRFGEVVYSYGAHEGSRTMAGTWTSYRAVHEANLTLARVLEADPAERGEAAALRLISAAAAARAAFAAGAVAAATTHMARALGSSTPGVLRLARRRMKLRAGSAGW